MKIKNLQITSYTLDLELDVSEPICVLRGQHSDLVLDLIRELIGDYGAENDPDCIDDGRFVLNADIEIDGKNYTVCYIRNADFMGDNRIAANFVPNGMKYSQDDTVEFIDKCNMRDKDSSNIICASVTELKSEDDRPVFIYNIGEITHAELEGLANSGRQVFIACMADVHGVCESLQGCIADIV